jgi:hypothetical protein
LRFFSSRLQHSPVAAAIITDIGIITATIVRIFTDMERLRMAAIGEDIMAAITTTTHIMMIDDSMKKSLKLILITSCVAISGPVMGSDRADLVKGLATYDAIATLARSNCPSLDHEKIFKNIFSTLLAINETDSELDSAVNEQENVKSVIETQLHKIGSDRWCNSAKFILKNFEK